MPEVNSDMPDLGEIPVLPPCNLELGDWRDGLIVRSPNWLGDAVMTLPALLQLKRGLPNNCGLFVVCPENLEIFYRSLPIIDFIIPLQRAHKPWRKVEILAVKSIKIGVALMFSNSLRDPFYFRLANVKKLFGAAARCRSFMLTKAFHFPKRKDRELNKMHHAAKYLSMAYALGAPEWPGDLPEFIVAREPEAVNEEVLQALEASNLLAIAPGAAYGPAKCWPVENFREVIKWHLANGGNVALIGASKEIPACEKAAEGFPQDRIFNLAGKTDLAELMLVLQHAGSTVANDSGVMHLGAALGGKGVAIFGSTDPSATSPVSTRWKILYEGTECSPCFNRECPKGTYECLKAITPEKVINCLK